MNCQSRFFRGSDSGFVSRRWFLEQCGVGLGAVALADLLATDNASAANPAGQRADPLAPKQPPHSAKAKNVIFLFMAGGPSQHELFDNKPKLAELDGTLPPPDLLQGYRAAFINPNSTLLGPKFPFARHGECGAELT